MKVDRYRVAPGSKVDLSKHDAGDSSATSLDKESSEAELEKLQTKLGELQQMLFAEGKHKVLVVLQGMDTSGKDGTIKHVFRLINPLGVRVANFKRPTEEELAHDYLWRVHEEVPGKGQVTIFNRSHYEDVLVVRVHDLVPKAVWKKRYDHIVDFERMLADEGTVIRKFFLHISKDEQKERLLERIENKAKNWKFEHGDLDERKLWDPYQSAYADAIAKTSTEDAPWYIVPSNKKWFRNLVISNVLIDTLSSLKMQYPPAPEGLADLVVD